MEKVFNVSVWQDDSLFVAQCLEVDLASQGETDGEALDNLREALQLHFESPHATYIPRVKTIEVEVSAD